MYKSGGKTSGESIVGEQLLRPGLRQEAKWAGAEGWKPPVKEMWVVGKHSHGRRALENSL